MTHVRQLDHLNLTVSDLDATEAFYADLFGFRVVEHGSQGGQRWAVLRRGSGPTARRGTCGTRVATRSRSRCGTRARPGSTEGRAYGKGLQTPSGVQSRSSTKTQFGAVPPTVQMAMGLLVSPVTGSKSRVPLAP